MAALDRWVHAGDPLPPLVRAGLAQVQFETIHPFLDGNDVSAGSDATARMEGLSIPDGDLAFPQRRG